LEISFASDRPVLVIGAAGVDMVGRLTSGLEMGTSNPARIRFSFGGVARNVAENLARLGQDVKLITAVGDDRFGHQLMEQATKAGVDMNTTVCSSNCSTGSYLAVLGSQGELKYALDDMNALSTLTPDYFRQQYSLFKDAALLFVDANLPEDSLKTIMSQAKRAKLPVFADPASTSLAARLKPYLSQLFMLIPNSAEAAYYCQTKIDEDDQRQSVETAKCLVAKGVELAIITLAEAGVCYATSETSGYIRAIRTDIADPTGAGDALSAALIFAMMNDIHLDDAIRLGVAAASLTLRHPGAVLRDLSLEKLYDQL